MGLSGSSGALQLIPRSFVSVLLLGRGFRPSKPMLKQVCDSKKDKRAAGDLFLPSRTSEPSGHESGCSVSVSSGFSEKVRVEN